MPRPIQFVPQFDQLLQLSPVNLLGLGLVFDLSLDLVDTGRSAVRIEVICWFMLGNSLHF